MKNRIRELRKMNKMTQEELAQLVGVSRQSIVAIEKGKYNPSLKLAFRIAKQFKCPVEYVFYEEKSGE